jgi:hypothetical protein
MCPARSARWAWRPPIRSRRRRSTQACLAGMRRICRRARPGPTRCCAAAAGTWRSSTGSSRRPARLVHRRTGRLTSRCRHTRSDGRDRVALAAALARRRHARQRRRRAAITGSPAVPLMTARPARLFKPRAISRAVRGPRRRRSRSLSLRHLLAHANYGHISLSTHATHGAMTGARSERLGVRPMCSASGQGTARALRLLRQSGAGLMCAATTRQVFPARVHVRVKRVRPDASSPAIFPRKARTTKVTAVSPNTFTCISSS